jgi:hypothetical protein
MAVRERSRRSRAWREATGMSTFVQQATDLDEFGAAGFKS